jgi:GH24 family phage-related lysozyme (muramidase)
MAEDIKPKPVKVGQIKGVRSNPLTADQEDYLKSMLPGISDVYEAAEFIKPLENQDTKGKAKLKVHKDVNGQLIVGWGTRADDLKEGDEITEADAQERLNVKLRDIISSIKRNGGQAAWDRMSSEEKQSILSTMHNTGASGAMYSRKPGDEGQYTEFFKAIISGDSEKAGKENDFGKLPGHKKRREAENEKAGRNKPKLEQAIPPAKTSGSN